MNPDGSGDITTLLSMWKEGDERALDDLVSVMYPELRRIARIHLAHQQPGRSLESAALANEVYLKLVRAGTVQVKNRIHFLSLCSQIMRHILVDYARRRNNLKRGGDATRVTLDEGIAATKMQDIDILALDQALEALAKIDQRKVRVVELRYFSGLDIEETAGELGISLETAKRDWRMAKAWLSAKLSGERADAS